MMKVPGNQFLTDYDLVAKEMNCSKGLLYQLHKISDLGNSFKTNNDLIWNKDCRYCARTYFDDEVWLGLYFDIKGNYTFILGFETESDCTKMEQKLKDNQIGNDDYYFQNEDEPLKAELQEKLNKVFLNYSKFNIQEENFILSHQYFMKMMRDCNLLREKMKNQEKIL